MKRLAAAVAGAFGIAAYLRRRRKKRAGAPVEPADELRAKLAETKAGQPPVEPEVQAEAQAETDPEAPPEPAAAAEPEPEPKPLDDRRRDVHDRARASIDELG